MGFAAWCRRIPSCNREKLVSLCGCNNKMILLAAFPFFSRVTVNDMQ